MAGRRTMNRVRVLPLDVRQRMTLAEKAAYNEARQDALMLADARASLVFAMGTVSALDRQALAHAIGLVIQSLDHDEELARF